MSLWPTNVSLQRMMDHSYQDFHVKGFDYLCLERSAHHTIKVYFFDGLPHGMPEVVAPHDHRYPFTTKVLAGELINRRYAADPNAVDGEVFNVKTYERFKYMTPLNGGDGFTWEGTEALWQRSAEHYAPGSLHSHRPEELHTIAVHTDRTVIAIWQGADTVALDEPTRLWRPAGEREPLSLDGLYQPMGADRIVDRLSQLQDLVQGPIPAPILELVP